MVKKVVKVYESDNYKVIVISSTGAIDSKNGDAFGITASDCIHIN